MSRPSSESFESIKRKRKRKDTSKKSFSNESFSNLSGRKENFYFDSFSNMFAFDWEAKKLEGNKIDICNKIM